MQRTTNRPIGKPITFFIFLLVTWVSMSSPVDASARKKVLWVDSYHQGYQWCDDIEMGMRRALGFKPLANGTLGASPSGVELKIFRMDTKRNPAEAFKKKAALSAKALIERWRPDVVIASDDNASKYLIAPYYRNTALPVVFCGVNGDASVYGFPASNVTGMVEVDPLAETIATLKPYAGGHRIGFIGADTLSHRKKMPHHTGDLGIQYVDGKWVTGFAEWKQEYLKLQKTVDILIAYNPFGIKGWDAQEAETFILENTRIPTGSIDINTMHLTLVARVKIGEEQGDWAGRAVLRILAGTSPADIPITRNQYSRLYLNMRLAERLKIRFPMDLIENATLVEEIPGSG